MVHAGVSGYSPDAVAIADPDQRRWAGAIYTGRVFPTHELPKLNDTN